MRFSFLLTLHTPQKRFTMCASICTKRRRVLMKKKVRREGKFLFNRHAEGKNYVEAFKAHDIGNMYYKKHIEKSFSYVKEKITIKSENIREREFFTPIQCKRCSILPFFAAFPFNSPFNVFKVRHRYLLTFISYNNFFLYNTQ